MDEQTRLRIFEPFFTTKEMHKGTGLGLASVYGIIKQSGGHINVYSEAGRGSTFRIYLPRVREALPASNSAKGMPRGLQGTETIVLAEDEGAVRRMVAHLLEILGYTVHAASDGQEALRIADELGRAPDLLITDVVMPGMSGQQLAELLQARFPTVKVIFCSGYTGEAMIQRGVVTERTHFLQKPFAPMRLAAKIREVLDGVPPEGIPLDSERL